MKFAMVLGALAFVASSVQDAAAQDEAIETRRLLERFGFGNPGERVFVVYHGPRDETALNPRRDGADVPPDTLWVFHDPRPVWSALAGARTKRFHEKVVADGEPRLTLTVGSEHGPRSIRLRARPGQADILILGREGEQTGGLWSFDRGADRALAKLLSNTPPTRIGVPLAWSRATLHLGMSNPYVRVVNSKESLAGLNAELRSRHNPKRSSGDASRLRFPRHFVAHVSLPNFGHGDRLEHLHARIRKQTLIWTVRVSREGGTTRPQWSPGLTAAFEVPAGLSRIRVMIDDRLVTEIDLSESSEYMPRASSVGLLVERHYETKEEFRDTGEIYLYGDGSYLWIRKEPNGGASRQYCGVFPKPIARQALEAAKQSMDSADIELGGPTWVLASGPKADKRHPGFRAAQRFLHELHADDR